MISFFFLIFIFLISGQHSDPRCVYVPPSTGKTFFTFRIAYARCGTKPDLNGQFYENTASIYQIPIVTLYILTMLVIISVNYIEEK